jgi:beta-ribofuranosylaminobenzene 5'-phosphate synthase
MTRIVTVTTGARLHFGLIVARGDSGPTFGSVGTMVDEPGFTVRAEAESREPRPHASANVAGALQVQASPKVTQRIAEFLAMYGRQRPSGPVRIEVSRRIPEHAGLGSGTQLALAVATALTHLFDKTPVSAWRLSQLMGRGRRSAIGAIGFEHGGCIFTSRWQPMDVVLKLPDAWRFVLVTPPHRQGLSGAAEGQAFGQMEPMGTALCARLDELVKHYWMPGIEDFQVFSTAMYEFGHAVGEYFAPFQGGAFADPRMAALVEHLRREGIAGVAQTSWGPTIVVLCEHQTMADRIVAEIGSDLRWSDCIIRCVSPLNRGASIVCEH